MRWKIQCLQANGQLDLQVQDLNQQMRTKNPLYLSLAHSSILKSVSCTHLDTHALTTNLYPSSITPKAGSSQILPSSRYQAILILSQHLQHCAVLLHLEDACGQKQNEPQILISPLLGFLFLLTEELGDAPFELFSKIGAMASSVSLIYMV